jgi:hypothetical protein
VKSDYGLIKAVPGGMEKSHKTSVKISGVEVEMRSEHLRNTSLDRYLCYYYCYFYEICVTVDKVSMGEWIY